MDTISKILQKKGSKLSKLIEKTRGSENLEAIFHAALEENIAKHCQFANFKDSLLTVTVSNSSWAMKLRYTIPDIVKNLRIQPEFKELTKIRYTIAKPNQKTPKKKHSPEKISKENEKLWHKTIADLQEKTSG